MFGFNLSSVSLILLCFLVSYLLGSLDFAILVSRSFGEKKDIRNLGSNNAGFANALRSLGLGPSILTFFGDFMKGVVSMLFVMFLCKKMQLDAVESKLFFLTSQFFCCIGHMFPIFFQFKGGKSILTTWACIFFADWRVAVILISIFLITLIISKIVSLSSIIVAALYPFLMLLFGDRKNKLDLASFFVSLVISWMILIRHKKNIKRLIGGEEKKINLKR